MTDVTALTDGELLAQQVRQRILIMNLRAIGDEVGANNLTPELRRMNAEMQVRMLKRRAGVA